ncbi:tRNA pseudouridine(55) synthase TruB [[Mycoplasma] collis]|uniref:tRNA pseudouridine(55) synthase TruB n=1 Tax=[Mycoplasma] collis TaxID=2127 RepID=UPI00051AAE17|nr:tRNA pseudouridine(55) synthase TruB [[Mycoplasma] collis]
MIKLLYKEKYVSSFQKIKNFAKLNNIKKIGHSGTLDPFAEGLLLIATDEDTKLIPYIDSKFKTYEATIQLGLSSDTLDMDGAIIKHNKFYNLDKKNIVNVLNSFKGISEQIPPHYSAKKINGQRAYKLARENKIFELQKQSIEISEINFLNFDLKNQLIKFNCTVSRGTYIRVLIKDIVDKLNVKGLMSELIRTKINNLTFKDLNKSKLNEYDLISEPIYILNIQELKNLFQGKKIKINNLRINYFEKILILGYKKNIIGVGEINNEFLKPKKLFGKKIERILQNE